MSHNESLSLEMLRDGTGAAVRDDRGRPLPRRDAHFALETCVLPSRTTVGTALSSAKCTSRRRGLPPWSPSDPRRPSRGSAAALVVRICCKGPDRAEAHEGNSWYSALLLAADPGPERFCNRFGHAPAPGPPQEPHPHHPAPARPRHHDDPGRSGELSGEKGPLRRLGTGGVRDEGRKARAGRLFEPPDCSPAGSPAPTAPFSLRYAFSPSTAREKEAQRRVKGRSRREEA